MHSTKEVAHPWLSGGEPPSRSAGSQGDFYLTFLTRKPLSLQATHLQCSLEAITRAAFGIARKARGQ